MTRGASRHHPTRTRPRHFLLAAGLTLVLLTILTASCSSGSPSPGVAGAGATTTTSASSNSSSSSRQDEALKYSQCMRSHGVPDFPDPNASGGINVQAGPGGDLNPDNPTFQAAQKACEKYSPEANLTPAQKAQQQAKLLKYAQCMRSHGVTNFPDPGSGPSGGFGIKVTPGSGLDPNSPTFQAAQKACQKNLGGAPLIANRSAGGAPGSGGK
jgi:hypothetical protein